MISAIFKRFLIILGWLGLIALAVYFPLFAKTSKTSRSLTILTWGDILEPTVIAEFEEKTGISVNLSYYASNEELLVKLKATGGLGYDIIIPSDYAVPILASYDLLKPLDKSKLLFWDSINPKLLGQPFDPENRYSIPFEWEIFGFGIDSTYFTTSALEPSWSMLFDTSVMNYPIVMTNDPIEAIQFASFYLFGPKKELHTSELQKVQDVLQNQRQFIEAYANFRADYFLATKNCPLVITSSSYIWRTKKQYPFVDFVIPKEGSFMTIENMCIPKPTQKEALVYEFLNEIFSQESAQRHFEAFGFFPSVLKAEGIVGIDPSTRELLLMDEGTFSKLHFISELATQEQIQHLWVSVKTSTLQ